LRELFQAVAGLTATARMPGAFLGGPRLLAVDCTTLDLADTLETALAFGRPTTHRGHKAGDPPCPANASRRPPPFVSAGRASLPPSA
jgi:hypothetical protein